MVLIPMVEEREAEALMPMQYSVLLREMCFQFMWVVMELPASDVQPRLAEREDGDTEQEGPEAMQALFHVPAAEAEAGVLQEYY